MRKAACSYEERAIFLSALESSSRFLKKLPASSGIYKELGNHSHFCHLQLMLSIFKV